MDKLEIIKKASELLNPIRFEPHDTAYFVTVNGSDIGGEDYCIECIREAVKEARKYHREERQNILNKFKEIEETGFYKGKNIKAKYSALEIKGAKKRELKEYPAKVKFSYEGHDPDFAGGQHEPRFCASCGEYFDTNFEPDMEEAENLLEEYGKGSDISESLKWKLDIAFYNYEYLNNDVQEILLSIAKKIIKRET